MKRKPKRGTTLFFKILLFSSLISTVKGQDLQDRCSGFLEYQVQNEDTILSISLKFGSEKFVEPILKVNSNLFNQTASLTPGQLIKIPFRIFHFNDSYLSLQEVLSDPYCTSLDSNEVMNINSRILSELQETDTSETETLQRFREAFDSLVEQEKTAKQEEAQAEIEQQIFLEIDGIVVDETRSKIGRDFYDVFYQLWQAPTDAKRFTITISELPAPGLGTIIYVKVNDTETFRYRLQPRFDFIQEAGRYAVNLTYRYLEDEQREFTIY